MADLRVMTATVSVFITTRICYKLCNMYLLRTEAKSYDGKLYNFSHPIFKVVLVSVGRIVASLYFFIIVLYLKCRNKKRLHFSDQATGHAERVTSGRAKINAWLFLLPSIYSYVGLMLFACGQSLSNPGSATTVEALLVIIVPLMGKFYLKNKLHNYCWGGAIMVCIGYMLAGLGQKFGMEEDDDVMGTRQILKERRDNTVGLIMVFVGQILLGASSTLVEKHIKRHDIVPLIVNFWVGIFSVMVGGFFLLPAHYMIIPLFNSSPQNRFEDLSSVSAKLSNSPVIIWILILHALAFGINMDLYVVFVKDVNATTAQTLLFFANILAYISDLFNASARETFHWLMGMGLGFAVVGTLLYFDIIIMPIILWIAPKCCGRQEHPEKMDDEESVRDELSATDTARSGKQMTLQLRDISLAL